MGDLKFILVDRRAFMNPRMEYRLRFSVAHEIGHLILHHDTNGGLQIAEPLDSLCPTLCEKLVRKC